ncbi:MAG: dihydroxy-acid dehydratase [Candidatus Omnitrophota bacterium]
MRSDKIKKGLERAGNRALLMATGLSRKELNKPFIAVISSFTDIIPGHIGMRRLERFTERGICSGGGVPFIMGVPGICDGIAMGHEGMKYSLASREAITDMIETVVRAHAFDGMICLTNCDKITPGMLMAIARLNIPSIVVTAGPMYSGRIGKKRLSLVRDTFEAVGRLKTGDIGQHEFNMLEECACPGVGSCQGLYTANSMSCITEAMGMSMPGCGTALAASAKKERIAFDSGEMIVNLVRKNTTPSSILNKKAIENGIIMDMALGGSTNTILHLLAIAHEAGISLSLDKFDEISESVSHIVNIRPGGEYFMEDLEFAGGIPAVQKRLRNRTSDCMTVSGKRNSQIAREAAVLDEDVIKTLDKPFHPRGGIAILKGNLAPEGSVVKRTAVSAKMMKFKGTAVCFNSEEEAMKAILGEKIKPGNVIVIRYEGPKGGPGMREMLSPTSSVVGMGMSDNVALITDGRFSGGTRGPCIGHISPEAQVGGPLAIVKDGDSITIDITNKKLQLGIAQREIDKRLAEWTPPKPKIKIGYLARYAKSVSSASKGAVLEI